MLNQKGIAQLLIILNTIKQKYLARPFWQRLILGIAVILIPSFSVYFLVKTAVKHSFKKSQQIQHTRSLSITCPDNILYDQNSKMPIWIKGQDSKNITGENDQ